MYWFFRTLTVFMTDLLGFFDLFLEFFLWCNPKETNMRRIQSPEQMIEGRWYKIEVVESNLQSHRRLIQFRGWILMEGKITVLSWRLQKSGKKVPYPFYWEDLVSLEESHVS